MHLRGFGAIKAHVERVSAREPLAPVPEQQPRHAGNADVGDDADDASTRPPTPLEATSISLQQHELHPPAGGAVVSAPTSLQRGRQQAQIRASLGLPPSMSGSALTLVGAADLATLPREAAARAAVEQQVRLRMRADADAVFLATSKQHLLQRAVERQSRAEQELEHMHLDLEESMTKGMRSRQALDSLESHVMHMRGLLRQQDATGANELSAVPVVGPGGEPAGRARRPAPPPTFKTSHVKDAAELVRDELLNFQRAEDTEPCPKCAKRFLIGLLGRHLEACDGVPPARAEDDLDDSSDSDPGEDEAVKQRRRRRRHRKRRKRELEALRIANGGELPRDAEEKLRLGEPGAQQLALADAKDDASSDEDVEARVEKAMAAGGIKSLEQMREELALKRGHLRQCVVCQRSYPKAKIDSHTEACRKKQQLADEKAARDADVQLVSETATAPGAVQNFRVAVPLHNVLPLVWEPPVFNGGAPVFDYQIEFSKIVIVRESVNHSRQEEVPQPIVSTSCWVLAAPVAHRGHMLAGLEGGTTYTKLRVRAVNEKGVGPWSDVVEKVTTSAAVPPSMPVQLIVAEPPRPRELVFSWEPPLESGGGQIVEYELRFKEHVRDFAAALKGAGNGFKAEDRAVRFAAPTPTRYTVTRLRADTLYTDVRAFAVDALGRFSPPSAPVPAVRTSKLSREEHVLNELEEKRQMREMDVSVVVHDVHQVIDRQTYIRLLEIELKGIRARREAARAAAEASAREAREAQGRSSPGAPPAVESPSARAAAVLRAQEEEDAAARESERAMAKAARRVAGALAASDSSSAARDAEAQGAATGTGEPDSLAAEVLRRREQFEFRIKFLEGKVNDAQDEILRASQRRQQIKHVLISADRRWRLLTAESDRVSVFTGREMDTDVMHGRSQRFTVERLADLLREELSEVERTVQVGKREMLAVLERVKFAELVKSQQEQLLSERRAAHLAFEKEEVRRKRLMQIHARINQSSVLGCFLYWKGRVARKKKAAEKFHFALLRWVNLGMSRALRRWWKAVEGMRAAERRAALEAKDLTITGRGSALLEAALHQRQDALGDATALVAWMRSVEKELDGGDVEYAYRMGLREVEPITMHGARASMRPGSRAIEVEKFRARERSAAGGARGDDDPAAAAAAAEAEAAADPALKNADPYFGPAVRHTLPLWAVGEQVSRRAPQLKLVDGAKESLDPTMAAARGDSGAALALMDAHTKGIMDGEALARGARRDGAGADALARLGPDAVKHPTLPPGGARAGANARREALTGDSLVADAVDEHVRAQMARAEAFMNAGRYENALVCAKQCEAVFGWRRDARGLLAVYRLLSRLLEAVGRFDVGLLHWERVFELAGQREVADALAQAEALEGRARCLYERSAFEDALASLEKAEDIFEERNDQPSRARVFRLQARCMNALRQHHHADALEKRAAGIESRLSSLLAGAVQRLRELETELVGMGVGDSAVVKLEVCGPAVPVVRQQLRFLQGRVDALRAEMVAAGKVEARAAARVALLTSELERAEAYVPPPPDEGVIGTLNPEPPKLESSAITGAAQTYEVASLKEMLRREIKTADAQLAKAEQVTYDQRAKLGNFDDEINTLEQYAEAESHGLAKVAYGRRQLRCVALNASNWRTNNVLGGATGGIPKLAAALDSQCFVYSTEDGEAVNSFVGDSGTNPMGEPIGHTKPITCIAFFGERIYTGSADATVRAWSASDERGWGAHTPIDEEMDARDREFVAKQVKEQVLDAETCVPEKAIVAPTRDPEAVRRRKAGEICVMKGHEGSVVSLAANQNVVVSGGADRVVYVWHPTDGRLLRKLRGHELSVTGLALDNMLFCSCSADRDVRLWGITEATERNPASRVSMIKRFRGHTAPVTAVAMISTEVVSGAGNGEIICWDLASGAPIRRHQAHDLGRAVLCLQFDAVKIVSAGADARMVFTDFMSGEALQTSHRPHGDAHVLALAFDTDRLVTVGADRSMRHWTFRGAARNADAQAQARRAGQAKSYILRSSDKLVQVAKYYGASVKDLMRWNGVVDIRQLYAGMRIKIEPAPGSEEARARRAAKKTYGRRSSDAARDAAEAAALIGGGARAKAAEAGAAGAAGAAGPVGARPQSGVMVVRGEGQGADGLAAAAADDDALIAQLIEERRQQDEANKRAAREAKAKAEAEAAERARDKAGIPPPPKVASDEDIEAARRVILGLPDPGPAAPAAAAPAPDPRRARDAAVAAAAAAHSADHAADVRRLAAFSHEEARARARAAHGAAHGATAEQLADAAALTDAARAASAAEAQAAQLLRAPALAALAQRGLAPSEDVLAAQRALADARARLGAAEAAARARKATFGVAGGAGGEDAGAAPRAAAAARFLAPGDVSTAAGAQVGRHADPIERGAIRIEEVREIVRQGDIKSTPAATAATLPDGTVLAQRGEVFRKGNALSTNLKAGAAAAAAAAAAEAASAAKAAAAAKPPSAFEAEAAAAASRAQRVRPTIGAGRSLLAMAGRSKTLRGLALSSVGVDSSATTITTVMKPTVDDFED